MSLNKQLIFIAVLILVQIVVCGSVSGQDLLGGEIVTSVKPTREQRKQINNYVRYYADQFKTAESADQIKQARASLIEPLNRFGADEGFKKVYSSAVADQLSGALDSELSLVRLNVLIVVSDLHGDAGVRLMTKGLGDKNSAVRYWAAKAAAMMAGRDAGVLSDGQKERLIKGLSGAVADESSDFVVEQIYRGLAGLRGFGTLIDELERSLTGHLEKADVEALRVDYVGLQQLHRVVVNDYYSVNSKEFDSYLKRTAIVMAKYLQLASRLAGQVEDEQLTVVLNELVTLIEEYLKFAIEEMSGEPVENGPALEKPFKDRDEFTFKLNVNDWIGSSSRAGYLGKLGISFKDVQLPVE